LKLRRLLPSLAGLIVLAFALASLSRGTPGGSLLFRATWLLYIVYLAPVAVIVVMVALIVLIGLNYRELGAGIGFGLAQRRKTRKRSSRYSTFVAAFFWGLAIAILIQTKGSIFNPIRAAGYNVTRIVGENATAPTVIQSGGFVPALSSLVQNTWFSIAFLGLIIVGGLVVIQSVRVYLKEAHDVRILELQGNQEQGLQAVHEAIRLVDNPASDPRSRIIACYQYLVATASRLGAPVSSDLTARELDRAIRSTFALKGPATTNLTQLFEEARYSLHEIMDSDAEKAHEYLQSVAEELKIQLETYN
jgi:hypothetical protein